jgi:hypothetical protein
MYENPSAGRFDPPPFKDPAAPTPIHKRWWFYALMILTSYPASHWLLSGGRTSLGLLAPVLGLAAMAVNTFLTRKRHDEITGGDPYTPPNRVTR